MTYYEHENGGALNDDQRDALRSPQIRDIVTHCPTCGTLHLDEGEWRDRPHRTHLCAKCGGLWKPSEDHTRGVASDDKAVNDFAGWPDGEPVRYNACTDPCDMWTGPCACGAWHREGV